MCVGGTESVDIGEKDGGFTKEVDCDSDVDGSGFGGLRSVFGVLALFRDSDAGTSLGVLRSICGTRALSFNEVLLSDVFLFSKMIHLLTIRFKNKS